MLEQKKMFTSCCHCHRVNQQALPHIDIIDMREELSEGNRSMFSIALRQAIQERLDKKNK